MRILLIEDNESDAAVFQEAAKRVGMDTEVIWERDLGAGLLRLDEADILVVDLTLGSTTAEEVIAALARKPRKARMILTGLRDPKIALACGRAGLNYTPKTVDFDDLVLLLENAVGLFEFRQELSTQLAAI